MSKDDMFVVMAKILAYLYACMKEGRDPDPAKLAHDSDMLGINRRYHAHIMHALVDAGFVTGVAFEECWEEGCDAVLLGNPMVTISGIEFMYENSAMGRAVEFLKKNAEGVPAVVASLISSMAI